MATLDNSNIVNGNTIQTSDLLQLYSAFTAGGGYDVSISGSLTGSATSSSFATTSLTSSLALRASGSLTGSLLGTASFATSASFATTSLTSSLALRASGSLTGSLLGTASYADNGGVVTQLNSQAYSNIGAGPIEAAFAFYAGKVRIVSNTATTANFPGLAGKTLGTNVWVTATIQGQASSFIAPNLVTVRSLSINGAITIETATVPDTTEVHYHVIYVP